MPGVNLKWPDIGFLPKTVRWSLLLAVTAVFTFFLEWAHIPAALLLGPMLAGIMLAISNINIKIQPKLFIMAQGVVGCMVAKAITNNILLEAIADWPVFLTGVVSVIITATAIGYLLARRQVLPGTTAIWGSAPGAASAMVLMAEAYGADERLVAVMQYMRVVLIAIAGSILAHFFAPSHIAALAIDFFPPVDTFWLSITLLIALGSAVGAQYLHIPAGGMLVPLIVAVTLQNTGIITLVLPPWLLACSYTIIGCTIGLRFTRSIFVYALSAIPALLLSTLSLMLLCSFFAIALSRFRNVDLLTAYLATSPGGADSISIIAASTTVNLPFVMAYQTVRFILVTITGPMIARSVAKRIIRLTPSAGQEQKTEDPLQYPPKA